MVDGDTHDADTGQVLVSGFDICLLDCGRSSGDGNNRKEKGGSNDELHFERVA